MNRLFVVNRFVCVGLACLLAGAMVVQCQQAQTTTCTAVDLAHALCHQLVFTVPAETPDAGTESVAVTRDEQVEFVRQVKRRRLGRFEPFSPTDGGRP